MRKITLRNLKDDDLDQLFVWESDPESVKAAAFTRPDPTDRVAFDAHYAKIRSRNDVKLRAIEVDEVFVGTVSSFTIEGDREITYWIDPARRGQGIASSALELLLELDSTRPIFARVAEHNTSSIRVLEKCGFRNIGSEVSWAYGIGKEIVEKIYQLTTKN